MSHDNSRTPQSALRKTFLINCTDYVRSNWTAYRNKAGQFQLELLDYKTRVKTALKQISSSFYDNQFCTSRVQLKESNIETENNIAYSSTDEVTKYRFGRCLFAAVVFPLKLDFRRSPVSGSASLLRERTAGSFHEQRLVIEPNFI